MSALATISAGELGGTLARSAPRRRQDAFVCLLEPVMPGLRRTARAITRNNADAEDVQQTAVMRAYAHLGEFKGGAAPQAMLAAWLGRITANEAIDTLRRRHAGRVISFDDPTPTGEENPLLGSLTAPCDDPEQHYARMELRRHLADAIEQLEPRMRRVCLLRDVAQLSTLETAKKLGIPPTTVRVRLFRARLALRERLRHLFERVPKQQGCASRFPRLVASPACGD
jgi:RNA polymerase sigma-70 factor, ECF subfamily